MKISNICLYMFFCVLLSSCAPAQAPPYGSATNYPGQHQPKTQNNQPMQQTGAFNLAPVQGDVKVFIRVNNQTQVQEDLVGTVYALLQSEIQAEQANSIGEADYDINILLERFAQVPLGSSSGLSNAFVPSLMGTSVGASVGALIGVNDGALIGAGIGLVTGFTVGFTSEPNGGHNYAWQLDAFVTIRDKDGQTFRKRISHSVPAQNLSMYDSASAVFNNLAWSIVRSFKRM